LVPWSRLFGRWRLKFPATLVDLCALPPLAHSKPHLGEVRDKKKNPDREVRK
jgi:hypothetical protein